MKIAPFISVVVASFSFLFGVLQYANSDRNRLNKDFYDEKYRVFKELSKSISTIRYKILFADGDPEQIRKELIPVFEQHLTYITYSKLVLDTDIEIEKEVSDQLLDYERNLVTMHLKNDWPTEKMIELDQTGTKIIKDLGSIIQYEKEHINSNNLFDLFKLQD